MKREADTDLNQLEEEIKQEVKNDQAHGTETIAADAQPE